MKTAVVYASIHHKNTEKIAKEIAKTLKADLKNAINTTPQLNDYDLIGFGSGIFFWKHHKKILELVDSLENTEGKSAFIFSTSGLNRIRPDFHNALRTKLREKGFHIIGEFSCKGFDTFSFLKIIGGINKFRPDDIDLDNVKHFSKRILDHWKTEIEISSSERKYQSKIKKEQEEKQERKQIINKTKKTQKTKTTKKKKINPQIKRKPPLKQKNKVKRKKSKSKKTTNSKAKKKSKTKSKK